MSKLLFKSGFDGVSFSRPVFGNRAAIRRLVGTDTRTGFSWGEPNVWGALIYALLIHDLAGLPDGKVSDYVDSSLVVTDGYDGAQTTVLQNTVFQRGWGDTQVGLYMQPQEQYAGGDLYVRQWVRFPKDLAARIGPSRWFSFFGWKTDGDYRVELYVYTKADGKPYWFMQADNNANGGLPYEQFWSLSNFDVAVPFGKWFRLEVFWKRSKSAEGRIFVAIDGRPVFDRFGPNFGVNGLPINRIFPSLNYGGTSLPIAVQYDDLEFWDGFPGDAAKHLLVNKYPKGQVEFLINMPTAKDMSSAFASVGPVSRSAGRWSNGSGSWFLNYVGASNGRPGVWARVRVLGCPDGVFMTFIGIVFSYSGTVYQLALVNGETVWSSDGVTPAPSYVDSIGVIA